MAQIVSTRNIVDVMRAEGFPLPEQCREARVVIGYDQAFMVQYDVFLTDDDLVKLGRALQRIGQDQS